MGKVTREALLAWVTALPPGTLIDTDTGEAVSLVSERMVDVCFVIGEDDDTETCARCDEELEPGVNSGYDCIECHDRICSNCRGPDDMCRRCDP